MLTDLEIAQLLQSQYNGESIFDYQGTISGVTLAVKLYDDCTVVALEGSHDMPDWEHDFESEMIYPPMLNGAGVHAGFWSGIPDAIQQIASYLSADKPNIICGHSLGAGRVNLFTAALSAQGYTNLRRVKFASPRSNDSRLTYMLNKYPLSSYWNYHNELHHDFVGDVPRYIPPCFDFDANEPRTLIDIPPQPDDAWGLLAWHHLFLYIEGLQKLCEIS